MALARKIVLQLDRGEGREKVEVILPFFLVEKLGIVFC